MQQRGKGPTREVTAKSQSCYEEKRPGTDRQEAGRGWRAVSERGLAGILSNTRTRPSEELLTGEEGECLWRGWGRKGGERWSGVVLGGGICPWCWAVSLKRDGWRPSESKGHSQREWGWGLRTLTCTHHPLGFLTKQAQRTGGGLVRCEALSGGDIPEAPNS